MKLVVTPLHWSIRLEPRNHEVCVLYASGKYTTEQIGRAKGLTPRQVQRIAKQGPVLRTRAQSNRAVAELKSKHRIRQRSVSGILSKPPSMGSGGG